jgi:hypothetical protein
MIMAGASGRTSQFFAGVTRCSNFSAVNALLFVLFHP